MFEEWTPAWDVITALVAFTIWAGASWLMIRSQRKKGE
jgi:hypothetical protein